MDGLVTSIGTLLPVALNHRHCATERVQGQADLTSFLCNVPNRHKPSNAGGFMYGKEQFLSWEMRKKSAVNFQ